MIRALAVAALLSAIPAARAQDQNGAILEAARRVALNYARHLPNFLCTEQIRRLAEWNESGSWLPVDTLTLRVTYYQEKERYQLTARNGRASRQSVESLAGAYTQGEFGSVLRLIFDDASKTEFQWLRWDRSEPRPLAVFRYRVRVENSRYLLRALTKSVVAGYHGEVAIDPESGRTMRWTVIAEPPAYFPVAESITSMVYGLRQIAGEEYLLPVAAETIVTERPLTVQEMGKPAMRYRNVIDFRDYRKFSADARIRF